jgi:hypothetical protein
MGLVETVLLIRRRSATTLIKSPATVAINVFKKDAVIRKLIFLANNAMMEIFGIGTDAIKIVRMKRAAIKSSILNQKSASTHCKLLVFLLGF